MFSLTDKWKSNLPGAGVGILRMNGVLNPESHDGINTRAGYIAGENNRLYRYVVMINTPAKSTKPIMRKLRQILQ